MDLPDYSLLRCNLLQLLTCTHIRDNILTEQQMMEDKIKATDWEATNEAIEEQVCSFDSSGVTSHCLLR